MCWPMRGTVAAGRQLGTNAAVLQVLVIAAWAAGDTMVNINHGVAGMRIAAGVIPGNPHRG